MKILIACLAFLSLSFTLPVMAQDAAVKTEHVNPFTNPVAPAAAPVAAASAVDVMVPANPEPIADYTKYYAKRTATVTSGDKQKALTYFWFAPEQPWAEGAKFPLILLLHGASGFAEAGRTLIDESNRKQFPAFIAVPALPEGKRWADPVKLSPAHALPEAVEMVKQVIAANPAIDPKRVYVVGCGTGGTGAYGAAQLYSDVFAAALPFAATWNMNETSNMKNVAIAAFHGEDDEIVPYLPSNDTITMVQQAGGTAFFTKYLFLKHDCNAKQFYTQPMWAWLFQQHKP